MSDLFIKEVLTKRDLKKFVKFPNELYKDVPEFVPFMFGDEMSTFTVGKNPAYDFCETKLFLALKDNKVVGRIAGLINHSANKKWGTNNIRFTRFDFIDDKKVSKLLFDTVVNWGKERGYEKIIGPIGFTDMDHEGMLIEGFDQLNMSITFYNFPYYLEHMSELGLGKEIDWVEFKINVPEKADERLRKLSEFIINKNGYQLVTYNNQKTLIEDAYKAFEVIDKAFSVLYGTVPLTPEVIDNAIKENISLVNKDYVCSIKDKDGKIIAFALLVPSIAKALKKSNGKLFPFGAFRLLKALNGKNDTLEMFFVAVEEEYQKKGLPAIMMNAMLEKCIKNGVKYLETGPELENNQSVQSMWKGYDAVNHKRRRCFGKTI